ncbi:MAG: class I SAM-dependent methyltransferase [Beijerinckiaceae bacterium]
MKSWREYWDGDSPVYVNERHKQLHDARVAQDIAALIPHDDAVVLDHGCGEARGALTMAQRCARLYLCDGAPNVRARVAERYRADARMQVLAPEDIETAIPDGALDMAVANSLLQYLSAADLDALLAQWHRKLKTGGVLVLGDVVPPDISPVTDALALLRFGYEGGFLLAAMGGLVRTALSDYRKIRGTLGLSMHTEADMLALLARHGFEPLRHRPNIGHNQARMTFVARKRALHEDLQG